MEASTLRSLGCAGCVRANESSRRLLDHELVDDDDVTFLLLFFNGMPRRQAEAFLPLLVHGCAGHPRYEFADALLARLPKNTPELLKGRCARECVERLLEQSPRNRILQVADLLLPNPDLPGDVVARACRLMIDAVVGLPTLPICAGRVFESLWNSMRKRDMVGIAKQLMHVGVPRMYRLSPLMHMSATGRFFERVWTLAQLQSRELVKVVKKRTKKSLDEICYSDLNLVLDKHKHLLLGPDGKPRFENMFDYFLVMDSLYMGACDSGLRKGAGDSIEAYERLVVHAFSVKPKLTARNELVYLGQVPRFWGYFSPLKLWGEGLDFDGLC